MVIAATPELVIEYHAEPGIMGWYDIYDVYFDVFGFARHARVRVEGPYPLWWYVENPNHNVQMTDVEWTEWRQKALDIIWEHRYDKRRGNATT